jgi:hypothetical protein
MPPRSRRPMIPYELSGGSAGTFSNLHVDGSVQGTKVESWVIMSMIDLCSFDGEFTLQLLSHDQTFSDPNPSGTLISASIRSSQADERHRGLTIATDRGRYSIPATRKISNTATA